MQQNQRIILYILLLIAGAGWIELSAHSVNATNTTSVAAPQAGFPAPDFTLQTMEGKSYTLSELRGQAILVNLWATWCPPCKAEMPTIEKVYEEYKDKGLVVLAVNMTQQDNPLDIAPFVQKYKLTFPILLDNASQAAAAYQVTSLPSSFFINRKGIIQQVVIGGPMSELLLRARVEEILQ